jgi:16S rRNA (uracil1498-N3)-methyltransferase
MARNWRVHHPEPPIDTGDTIDLSSEESHHVNRVLRLRVGDRLSVFDGRGREWAATLIDSAARKVRVTLEDELTNPVEATLDVVIYQGLCRSERMDWVVQKATELGVRAVHAVSTECVDAPPVTSQRLRRWQRIAIEACKQCGGRRVPLIEVADGLPAPSGDALLPLLLDPGERAVPFDGLAPDTPPERIWIAIGPESGFSQNEILAHLTAGWQPLVLGPRVFRTETAGIVAAALILQRWGNPGI